MKIFLNYLLKIIFCFTILLFITNYFAEFCNIHDPRKAIIVGYTKDLTSYDCILIGDSVFTSSYVDEEAQALWNIFEDISGKSCFPGALSGANLNEIINNSIDISTKARKGAVVFIDIIPTRFLMTNDNRLPVPTIAMNDFEDKLISIKAINSLKNFYIYKYPNVFEDRISFILNKYKYLDANINRNRNWNIDGDFALKRYKKFLEVANDFGGKYHDFRSFDVIVNNLRKNDIRVIFVLTPICYDLINKYSNINESENIKSIFCDVNFKIINYFKDKRYEYIDLSSSVPSDGFSDLLHTNAIGDRIVADRLAKYAFPFMQ